MTDFKNILIIKPSALGDIALTLPVVSTIKEQLPNAKLTWLVRKEFAPLLECVKGIDELLIFDRKAMSQWYCRPSHFNTLRSFSKALKSGRFDLVLDFQGLFRSGLFSWLTGCNHRYGMSIAREGARYFYSHKVQPPQSPHLLDYYYNILTAADIEKIVQPAQICVPASTNNRVERLLTQCGLNDKPFTVLVVGSAVWSKCWPMPKFAKLAKWLHDTYGYAIVTVGSPKEKKLSQQVIDNCPIPITDLAGQTNIQELMEILNRSSLTVSNDTGPGHIAASSGVPTVILFGHTNPNRVGPYNQPNSYVAIAPDKRGSTIENHNPAYLIENITVGMAIDTIKKRLQ